MTCRRFNHLPPSFFAKKSTAAGGFLLLCAWVTTIAMPAAAFVPNQRWSQSAFGGSSPIGRPITLTWSIVPDGTTVPGEGPSQLISHFDSHVGVGAGGNDLTLRPWFDPIRRAFDRWSELGGVSFVYEPYDDGATHGSFAGALGVRGDIRLSAAPIDGRNNSLAYGYYPNNGDIVLDLDDTAFLTNPGIDFIRLRNILMHELGHSLGFEHVVSSDASFLMEPSINVSIDGPQLDDIRALHHFYGDSLEKSNGGAGNNTLQHATHLGPLAKGATLTVGADAAPDLSVASNDFDFVSISNILDRDYYSFSITEPSTVNITLIPLGGAFHQGRPGESQIFYDTNASSNLALALFGGPESTLLALESSQPAGAIESISSFELVEPGEYFVRVTGAHQVVQLYQLDITHVAPITSLPGDYNSDGIIDAADYTVWRDALGSTGDGLPADGSGNGHIDQIDYDIWKANFGNSIASSGLATETVPEPSAAMLLACLALVNATFGRRLLAGLLR